MNTCAILYTDFNYEIKELDHKCMGHLIQNVTFVGAIPEISAVAVASSSSEDVINPFCYDNTRFDDNVRGIVILIGSDEEGERMDLDVTKLEHILQQIIATVK